MGIAVAGAAVAEQREAAEHQLLAAGRFELLPFVVVAQAADQGPVLVQAPVHLTEQGVVVDLGLAAVDHGQQRARDAGQAGVDQRQVLAGDAAQAVALVFAGVDVQAGHRREPGVVPVQAQLLGDLLFVEAAEPGQVDRGAAGLGLHMGGQRGQAQAFAKRLHDFQGGVVAGAAAFFGQGRRELRHGVVAPYAIEVVDARRGAVDAGAGRRVVALRVAQQHAHAIFTVRLEQQLAAHLPVLVLGHFITPRGVLEVRIVDAVLRGAAFGGDAEGQLVLYQRAGNHRRITAGVQFAGGAAGGAFPVEGRVLGLDADRTGQGVAPAGGGLRAAQHFHLFHVPQAQSTTAGALHGLRHAVHVEGGQRPAGRAADALGVDAADDIARVGGRGVAYVGHHAEGVRQAAQLHLFDLLGTHHGHAAGGLLQVAFDLLAADGDGHQFQCLAGARRLGLQGDGIGAGEAMGQAAAGQQAGEGFLAGQHGIDRRRAQPLGQPGVVEHLGASGDAIGGQGVIQRLGGDRETLALLACVARRFGGRGRWRRAQQHGTAQQGGTEQVEAAWRVESGVAGNRQTRRVPHVFPQWHWQISALEKHSYLQ
ncbi:hypothetical protein D9M70_316610 [compost metagenome]